MGRMANQAKSELKQLPYMLGKLLGALMAVIGFTAAVIVVTRKTGQSPAGILPYAILGSSGIIVFVLSSRILAKRLSEYTTEALTRGDRTRMSGLSWVILSLLAAIFLFGTWFMTK
jgi:predicted neutral ceramidase superfamily lipid hydrolase